MLRKQSTLTINGANSAQDEGKTSAKMSKRRSTSVYASNPKIPRLSSNSSKAFPGSSALRKSSSSVKRGLLVKKVSSVPLLANLNFRRRRKNIKAPIIFDPSDEPKRKEKKHRKVATPPTPQRELYYRRGEYLAVRSDEDDFYLCQATQHVYADLDEFNISWLEKSPRNPSEYTRAQNDKTELDCVITHVKLQRVAGKKDTYCLPADQELSIENTLTGDDSDEEEEEEEEEEESDEEEQPKPRKKKTPSKKKGAKKGIKRTGKKAKSKGKPSKPKTTKKVGKKANKPEKLQKRKLTEAERRNPNLLLVSNPKIKVIEKDPLLQSNQPIPFVSVVTQSRLVHRAVVMNDHRALKKCIDDRKQIPSVQASYAELYGYDPLELAIKQNNKEAIKLLSKEIFCSTKERGQPPQSFITRHDTGRYNQRSLGIPFIRELTVSRGVREGNNALLKDLSMLTTGKDLNNYLDYALECGLPLSSIDVIYASAMPDWTGQRDYVLDHLVQAVRRGHRELAGKLVDEAMKHCYGNPFNNLHKNVLQFKNEDLGKFRDISCQKKPFTNYGITPIHCAAINPNTKYLSRLLSVLPEYNLPDKQNRRPIHYAAACSGTGPLEYLLKRGVESDDVDNLGMTPLMVAALAKREANVDLLLKTARDKKNSNDDEDEGSEDGFPAARDFGVGGVNRTCARPTSSLCGYAAIHLAIQEGHENVLKLLLRHGADVHQPLGPRMRKMTPFMLAAAMGHFNMCRMLYGCKARVEEKDRLKRTALIHAAMNGHAHVVSYLLNLGADPNVADSSGNTAMHYAAAYGWPFVVKLLAEAGAEPNSFNYWKITPMWMCYLKGYMGMVDQLLKLPQMDINFTDNSGLSLLMIACSSPLVAGLEKQIEDMVLKRGASVTLKDNKGNTCLHLLAANGIMTEENKKSHKKLKKVMDMSVRIAELLLDAGCDATQENKEGQIAISLAVMESNVSLVKVLSQAGRTLPTKADANGCNILHHMAKRCLVADQTAILKTLVEGGQESEHKLVRNQLKDMAQKVNYAGYTPLLTACQAYAKGWCQEGSLYEDSDNESDADIDDEDEEEGEQVAEELEDDAVDEQIEEEEEEEGDNDLDLDPDPEEENGDVDTDEGIEEDEQMEEEDDMEEDAVEELDEEQEEMEEEDNDDIDDDDDDEDETKKEQLAFKHGREFMKTLLELCQADVNAQVQKRKITDPSDTPLLPEEFYRKPRQAEYRAINYMLEVKKESAVTSGKVMDRCPGLSLILRHGTALDHFTLSGNSPLTQVITRSLPQDVKVDAVKKLIAAGANVNLLAEYINRTTKKKNTAPPVVFAAKGGLSKVIAVLVHGRVNLEAQDSLNGNTALHYAVQKPREIALDMVSALVKAGSKVNARNKKRQTPLHLAANSNVGGSDVSSEMESLLLDSGADMKAQDVFGRTPLHYVFVNEGDSFANHAIDPIELCSTLTSGIGATEVNIPDKYRRRALHYAAMRGAGVCAMNLLQKKADINIMDSHGNTAFGLAAISKHSSCCILLLQQGANFNCGVTLMPNEEKARITREEQRAGLNAEEEDEEENWFRPEPLLPHDWTRYPAFQVCVHNEWQGVLYIMLDRLAQVGLPQVATVQAALKTQRYNLALTLIRKIKDTATMVQIDQHGQNAFHTLAAYSKYNESRNLQLRVAQLLYSRSVSLKTRDDYGCQPIHYACLHHNTALTKFILEKEKMDSSVKSSSGHTAATAACWNLVQSRSEDLPSNFKTVCTEQLNSGAKLDTLALFPKVPPIATAVEPGAAVLDMAGIVKEFQETKDCVLQSPLIFSIVMHDFLACKFLLKKGARVNFTDQNKMTPMMKAVQRNDLNLVKLLMDHSYERPVVRKSNNEDEDMDDMEASHDGSDDEDEDRAGPSTSKRPKVNKRGRRVFALGEKQSSLTKQESVQSAKSFKRQSSVELNLQDHRGWTVLHHLVSPLEYGTFDNVDLLHLLLDNGAKLDIKNNEGLTPLNLALMSGAVHLAQALQKMSKTPASMQREIMLLPVTVDDGIKWENSPPDFKEDAEKMIKSAIGDDAPEEERYTHIPDEQLELSDDGEILLDKNLDEPFDVMLIKVDMGRGCSGLYNFYKMQIALQKSTSIYFLFNCWGRIGDSGMNQKTPFSTEQEAITEFKKIFKSKTGNQWDKIHEFEIHNGKYKLVRVEEKVVKKKYRPVTLSLPLGMPSRLPQCVRKLIQEFSNMRGMCKFMDQLDLDTQCMPFGRISEAVLQEAKEVLKQLMPLIKKLSDLREQDAADHTEEIYTLSAEIIELNNSYHSKIPQEGFQYNTLSCISTSNQLQTEFRNLEHLYELELAGRMISGAQYRAKEINPMDYIYRCLDCQIEPMEYGDVEAQYIRAYINSSQDRSYRGTIRLRGIYRVHRLGEEEQLMSRNLDNHKLLFHGTKTFNMLSILRRGLVVGPKEAPATGNRLGKGIYFTDAFSKSLDYCENMNDESADNFMLVCQVALGKLQNVYSTEDTVKRDTQYDSIKAEGELQPDPNFTITLPTGALIPLGQLKQVEVPKELDGIMEFTENEYVVDQEDQICMRYLIRFSMAD